MLSIGDMSTQTGVKIPTIRYYEQMGLLEAPVRSEGNQRKYSNDELERLSFIRHARDLGFTIDSIRDLLSLSLDPKKSCKEAHRIASGHLNAIQEQMARLKKLERELKRIQAVSDTGHIGKCSVIQALADHSLCRMAHDKK
jgi:DNA-binding transcriptional MerR regulator